MLPTLADLKRHADRFGPDHVLESARHLSDEDQEALARHLRRRKRAAAKAHRETVKARAAAVLR